MKPSPRHALEGLQAASRQHRVSILWATCALLAGFGITAVAVAPLVPEPEAPTIRKLVEAVEPHGIEQQLQALANLDLTLARSEVTRGGDTAYSLLTRMGVRDTAALGFMLTDPQAKSLFAGRAGKMVQVRTDADGALLDLVARSPAEAERFKTHFTRLRIEKSNGDWQSTVSTVPYGTEMRLSAGTIRSSLFAATDEAGLPDAVAVQLADIFGSEIDMHRQLRRGDTFSVVYEALTADGQPVPWNGGVGRVAAAEFVNAGRAHHAVWFAHGDKRGNYYGLDGKSRRNAFLASPMEFSRVTSGFAMRIHPIFQTARPHLGVDYGAPRGTAVRTVGDGVVTFAGVQTGYGNVIEIKHDNERSTLYAHLSRIDIKLGQRVEQGQTIGGVGSTGWATGPHLHFEFRIKGVHQDPLLVAKAVETTTLDAEGRARFTELSRLLQAKLDVAETMAGGSRRIGE